MSNDLSNNSEYTLYSEFDLSKHKETFVNYLEVMILEDGTVVYAVPSHQEKAIEIACDKLGICRQELMDMCPREYYADFMTWLCMVGNVVAVWNNTCVATSPNRKQVAALKRLKLAGVYRGALPRSQE